MRPLLLLLLALPSVALGQDVAAPPDPEGVILTGTLGWAVIGAAGTGASALVAALGHVWRANQAQHASHAAALIVQAKHHAEEVQTVRAGYQVALAEKAAAEVAALERHAAELVRLDDRYASSQERFTDAILGRLQ
jgi:hypothetical protein